MRCCKKIIKQLTQLFCTLMLCGTASLALAEGIEINKAEARLSEEGYLLSADFIIQLPTAVEDALKRGITLYFVSEFSVHRSRWYWIDSEIESYAQTTKLSYNTLTQQYRISRGGLYQSFPELKAALRTLGHQTAPAISSGLLEKSGGGYLARWSKKGSQVGAVVVMRLDLTQLPKPVQVSALTNDQWNLESTSYHWDINPDTSGGANSP